MTPAPVENISLARGRGTLSPEQGEERTFRLSSRSMRDAALIVLAACAVCSVALIVSVTGGLLASPPRFTGAPLVALAFAALLAQRCIRTYRARLTLGPLGLRCTCLRSGGLVMWGQVQAVQVSRPLPESPGTEGAAPGDSLAVIILQDGQRIVLPPHMDGFHAALDVLSHYVPERISSGRPAL